jgi:hypothetical protein
MLHLLTAIHASAYYSLFLRRLLLIDAAVETSMMATKTPRSF